MTKHKKSKYLHPLHFLKDGYMTIPLGVQELVDASNVLITNKCYAQALSLSVIALEECGKLFIFDSLVFMRNKENDYHKRSSISHIDKLEAAQFCISLLMNMSKFDDRSHDEETKEGFRKQFKSDY